MEGEVSSLGKEAVARPRGLLCPAELMRLEEVNTDFQRLGHLKGLWELGVAGDVR